MFNNHIFALKINYNELQNHLIGAGIYKILI